MNSLLEFCKNYKKIFCYGAGYYGKIVRIFLEEHGIEPHGFFVTGNPEQEMTLGLTVRRFDFDNIDKQSGIIVCVGSRYRNEITSFLDAHHVNEYICFDEKELADIEHSLEYRTEYSSQRNVLVLYYHRVCSLHRDIRRLAVDPRYFELHIKYLKDNYPILRFEDDWSNVSQKSVVITFDDGYDDFYEFALPILEKYDVPAMLFVSSGILDGKQGLWTDGLEQMIFTTSKEELLYQSYAYDLSNIEMKTRSFFQIRSLLKAMPYESRKIALSEIATILGTFIHDDEDYVFLTKERLRWVAESHCVSIGGHTVTHTSLSSESRERQHFEISTCKNDLETIIGKPITCFSYPYGDYTEDTVNIAARCGYKKMATTIPGIASKDTPFGYIPRCGISAYTTNELARQMRKLWTLFGSEQGQF